VFEGESRAKLRRAALGGALTVVFAALSLAGAVSNAAAEAPLYDMSGSWSNGYLGSGGERAPANGSYTITSMNMTTGALSGTAEVSGIDFVVEGVESGSVARYTLKEGGYTAYDTLHLSLLPDGHLGGEGTFNSIEFNETGSSFWAEQNTAFGEEPGKKAKEEPAKKEEAETTAKRPTATSVVCDYEFATSENSCVASVGDAGPGAPVTATGSVKFTTTSGGFSSGATCTLSPTPGSPSVASCPLVYQTANSGLPEITATYSGDSRHAGSVGHTQFLGTGSSEAEEETPPGKPGEYPNEVVLDLEVPASGTTVEAVAQGPAESPAPVPMALPESGGLDAVSAADLKLVETDAKKVDDSGAQNASEVKELDQSIEKLNQRAVEVTRAGAPAEQAESQTLTKDADEAIESISKMLKKQQELELQLDKSVRSSAFAAAHGKHAKRTKTKAIKPLAQLVRRHAAAGKSKLTLKLDRAAVDRLAGKRNSVTVYVRVDMLLPSALYSGGIPRAFVKPITLKRTARARHKSPKKR
jgi:hypothetical protein